MVFQASLFLMCWNLTCVLLKCGNGASVKFLHKDELWSYLGKKQKQLWVFIGFEVESRFWINLELGSRTTHTATKLVSGIKKYLKPFSADRPLNDKLAAYKNALQSVATESPYGYLQIVKRLIHKRLVTVKGVLLKAQRLILLENRKIRPTLSGSI